MHYTCPSCHKENSISHSFQIEEYVCNGCSQVIDVKTNHFKNKIQKPAVNVVLTIGAKGILGGIEYTVVAIVIRKYGSHIRWREYFLKDSKNNDAFLSESDGHWVLLKAIDASAVKKQQNDKIAEYNFKKYRWYETTPSAIEAAAGFFEEKLNKKLTTYKEYVNASQVISQEDDGGAKIYFLGEHIDKNIVKKAFNLTNMPNYSGIGIVQPYYFNTRQIVNVFGVVAILICLLQFYVYSNRMNSTVFLDEISFDKVKNKEIISKSFSLSGGAAPLKIEAQSQVDNSWANVQLSLVNEITNEITFASKDIEEYHGVDGGESWSEGSNYEAFNLCGVTAGTYHFIISAEKDTSKVLPFNGLTSKDSKVMISRDEAGLLTINLPETAQIMTFADAKAIENDTSNVAKQVKESFSNIKLDSLLNAEASNLSTVPENKSITLKATWLPVSFWNFAIVLIFMIIWVILVFVGKHYFNVSKWENSSNSPYPKN